MVTFADRMLVHLSDPNNVTSLINGMNLGPFLTTLFQAHYNTEFWQISQVAVGARRRVIFEQPIWLETRLLGREDTQSSPPVKTSLDFRVYGQETALWADLVMEFDTTWLVDQFPGSINLTPMTPANYLGVANLISVLRVDANNRPLDPSGIVLQVAVNPQGQIQTDPPNPVILRLDPLAGALLRPDQSIFSLVQLELFPMVGPAVPVFGVPLGLDGQPLPNLRIDNQGRFTDLGGGAVQTDPITGLPLDGAGVPLRPARLTFPNGGSVDYRFTFSLPVDTARQTFQFPTRLHFFILPELNLVEDLHRALTLGHRLGQQNTSLLTLSEPANRQANAVVLVYETNAVGGSGLSAANVRRLGEAAGVLIHFFSIP